MALDGSERLPRPELESVYHLDVEGSCEGGSKAAPPEKFWFYDFFIV